MIAILNYQAGNLKSLINALNRHGLEAVVTDDSALLLEAPLVILPGVGAFPDAAHALESTGLAQVLKARHAAGKPILGICLGMQLFFEDSDEGQLTTGLGLMQGRIRRLSPDRADLKVPHMGWNELMANDNMPEDAKGFEDFAQADMYFVHSYGLTGGRPEETVFHADHGQRIPALVYRPKSDQPLSGALIGFQFHPEKSGVTGEQLLIAAIQREVTLT